MSTASKLQYIAISIFLVIITNKYYFRVLLVWETPRTNESENKAYDSVALRDSNNSSDHLNTASDPSPIWPIIIIIIIIIEIVHGVHI